MIGMCYAKMSSPASRNRLILEIPISEGRGKVFIDDFDGGIATLSEDITGTLFHYALYGTKGGGYINLVRERVIEHTLYALREISVEIVILINPHLFFTHCERANTHYRMQKDFYKKTTKA
ncbi:Uncharacterised protein [Klebsiella variicola]|nr:Uncharacterised protein [Klebsiella variicola]